MNLSAEQFDRIVASLKSEGRVAEGREKRRGPRVGLRARVTIVPIPRPAGASPLTATLRDISAAGVGLLHAREVQTGSQFILCMPGAHGESVGLLCTAHRCSRAGESLFAVGATYTRLLSEAGTPRPPGVHPS